MPHVRVQQPAIQHAAEDWSHKMAGDKNMPTRGHGDIYCFKCCTLDAKEQLPFEGTSILQERTPVKPSLGVQAVTRLNLSCAGGQKSSQ